jgi:hypothetical protein
MRTLISLGITAVLMVAAVGTWSTRMTSVQAQPGAAQIDILKLEASTNMQALPANAYEAF